MTQQATQRATKVSLFTKTSARNRAGENIATFAPDIVVGGRITPLGVGDQNQDGLKISQQRLQVDLPETARTRQIEMSDRVSINNIGWVIDSVDDGFFQNGILRFTVRRDDR